MSSAISDEMDSMADVGEGYSIQIVIPSDPAAARQVQDEIEDALKTHQYPDREIFSIKLAIEEALVNAIKHGNQLDRNKNVSVAFSVSHDRFDVKISDEGPGFDPEDVPDPTAVENLERPSGRGLMLMRHYMNEVRYNGSGNSVYMTKFKSVVK